VNCPGGLVPRSAAARAAPQASAPQSSRAMHLHSLLRVAIVLGRKLNLNLRRSLLFTDSRQRGAGAVRLRRSEPLPRPSFQQFAVRRYCPGARDGSGSLPKIKFWVRPRSLLASMDGRPLCLCSNGRRHWEARWRRPRPRPHVGGATSCASLADGREARRARQADRGLSGRNVQLPKLGDVVVTCAASLFASGTPRYARRRFPQRGSSRRSASSATLTTMASG
jgi:hypothetical protein